MNFDTKKIQWEMHGDPPNISDVQVSTGEICRPITENELNIVLHPFGNWILRMTFDDRAIDKIADPTDERRILYDKLLCVYDYKLNKSHVCYPVLNFKRIEYFNEYTRVKDVLECIASGPCYGYFEGLKYCYIDVIDNIPVYKLCWGT